MVFMSSIISFKTACVLSDIARWIDSLRDSGLFSNSFKATPITFLENSVFKVLMFAFQISYENSNAAKFANCYTNHDGCSGITYRLGVKKGIELSCPAVAFYENTKGVADAVTDDAGTKHRPRIEATNITSI